MKLPTKKRLREIADRLWSLTIRDDWGYCCAVCKRTPVEAHHLIPRQWYATRYDLRNGIALCCRCHKFDAAISPHLNAAAWMAWLRVHQCTRHQWVTMSIATNEHKAQVSKTATYFTDVIRSLKEYVAEDEYRKIVGVRLAERLDAEDKSNG